MKRNNFIVVIIYFLVTFNLSAINNTVKIFVPNNSKIDFSKYDKIILQEYILKGSKININHRKIIRDYFLIEFPKLIKNTVEVSENRIIDIIGKNNDKKKAVIINKDFAYDNKKVLIINLSMNLTIDSRHTIKETVNKYGDKVKSFVEKKLWEMEATISLIEIHSKKIIREYKIKKRNNHFKGTSNKYNFKYLFDKIMENFLEKINKKGSWTNRYILTSVSVKNWRGV